MKYHTLLLSKIRKNVAKFVVCCSLDWRFKGYLSFDLIGSGVSTTVWLRCSVAISLDGFCHVYKLSSLPAKQKKTVLLTYLEKEINAKLKTCTLLCLKNTEKVVYDNLSC